jgi:hypothetical protein
MAADLRSRAEAEFASAWFAKSIKIEGKARLVRSVLFLALSGESTTLAAAATDAGIPSGTVRSWASRDDSSPPPSRKLGAAPHRFLSPIPRWNSTPNTRASGRTSSDSAGRSGTSNCGSGTGGGATRGEPSGFTTLLSSS